MQPVYRPLREVLLSVLFLTLIVFSLFFPRLLISPLLVEIRQELGMTAGQATRLFLSISIGFVSSILASGYLAQRLQHFHVITIAIFTMGCGMLFAALSQGPITIHIAMFIVGSAAGLYPPSGLSSLAAMVRSEDRGKALSIHELGPAISFVAAPSLVAVAANFMSWRMMLGSVAAACFVLAPSCLFFGRFGRFHGEPPSLGNLKQVLSNPQFWILALLFALAASAAVGVYNVLPTFLIQERGMSTTLAGSLIGASRVPGIFMLFGVGIAVDKLGFSRLIALTAAATGVMTILIGTLDGLPLRWAVLLQPMIVGAFFPAVLTALSELGPPESRNVAISLIIPAGNLAGAGLFPAIAGLLADYGFFFLSFVITGVLLLGACTLAVFLRMPPEESNPL
jgi:MFS transporter, NNP family, nitrate/nitrite transporter